MDELLALLRSGDYNAAKNFIDQDLRRTDFIFGYGRSDFMYYLNLHPEAICLDIGCGLGIHTFNIAPRVKKVYACDLSRKRVEFCQIRAKMDAVTNVEIFHSDIVGLPFTASSLDNIVMNGVLEWVPEANNHPNPRTEQINVLGQMRDLLKSDGILYVGIENRFALNYLTTAQDHNRLMYTTFMPRWLASIITRLRKGKWYRTYTYSVFGYRRLFKDAGFDLAKLDIYIAHPGYNLPQYLIPFEDIGALRFFLFQMTQSKGWKGTVVRFFARSDWFIKILRHSFYSYAFFAKK